MGLPHSKLLLNIDCCAKNAVAKRMQLHKECSVLSENVSLLVSLTKQSTHSVLANRTIVRNRNVHK